MISEIWKLIVTTQGETTRYKVPSLGKIQGFYGKLLELRQIKGRYIRL